MIDAAKLYDELTETGRYARTGESLCMINHHNPISIKHTEFKFLHDMIVSNNLKRGYELATAFGISALAAGIAFKQTGGKIVTMDCYIEENSADCMVYMGMDKGNYSNPIAIPDGLVSANWLIEKYGLQNTVFPEIGWSPDDTTNRLSKHYDIAGGEKLDYVFIDAGHWDEAGIRDINSVKDYLADNCFVFFHDTQAFGESFDKCIREIFGKSVEIVLYPPQGFWMGMIRKNG